MITRFRIENFKRLETAVLELGDASVFIGPNNSGKTTALQALAMWDIGWRRWSEKRSGGSPARRSGVTINRKDLAAVPAPTAKLLWRDLRVQTTSVADGKQANEKVFITLAAEGVHQGREWVCRLQFYYANEESFYCKLVEGDAGLVPTGAQAHSVVFLPPMSGLAEREYRKEPGEINVLIGEGQTAQVLRNLCWRLFSQEDKAPWKRLVDHMFDLFQVDLLEPGYIRERGELTLGYRERSGVELDVSSVGRGTQQVLLLLSYLLLNPGAVLLLDEPDAHLEILRQRDVYNVLTEIAATQGSQIVAASHSEVILQEAAERDVVLAFVGRPHRIDTRSSRAQVRKALNHIRIADYYVAEQTGWMLYLEGSTDLAILKRLAERMQHPAADLLRQSVPVNYLGTNVPQSARDHFHGLREARPDLVGFAIFDRLDKELHTGSQLVEVMWRCREIENLIVTPASLRAFAVLGLRDDDLFELQEKHRRLEMLESCVAELEGALELTDKHDPWGPDIKVTDEFLDPLFKRFYERLGTPQRIFKRDYHGLADCIELNELPGEIGEVLDELVEVAKRARPAV